MCVCVREREREHKVIQKIRQPTVTERRRRCLYSHLLSMFSHYNHHLQKRWRLNYLLNMCHRTLKFYDTLVTILGGGVFTHLSIRRCVPVTLERLSLILNTPLQTQLLVARWLVRTSLWVSFESTPASASDGRLTLVFIQLCSTSCRMASYPYSPSSSAGQ